MRAFLRIAKQWGIFAALTALFIWRDMGREDRMNTQICNQQAQFVGIQRDTIETVSGLKNSIDRLTDVIRQRDQRVSASGEPLF